MADWVTGWLALTTINIRERFTAIRVPTHLIAGELDKTKPASLVVDFCETPNSTIDVFPSAFTVPPTCPRGFAYKP